MTWNKFAIYVGLPLAFALSQHLVLAQGPFGNGATIRANIRPGGGDGKCTFEVEVDQVAEVEVRGDTGFLRTLSGSPATWRRLDCNGPLPTNPGNFRFKGIDGRGRQTLVRDPNSGNGTAVVRIEDPKQGREGYTGDLIWNGGSYTPTNNGNYGNGNYGNGSYGNGNGNYGGNNGSGWNNGGNGNGNWNNGGGNGANGNWSSGGWNHNGTGGWNNNGQRISAGDALNICQNEVATQSGASRDEVRVSNGGDSDDRGGYTVNFQIRSRNSQANGATGACRISRTGRIQDIRH